MRIVGGKTRLIDIGDVHDRFGGQQVQLAQLAPFRLAQRQRAHRLALIEQRAHPLEQLAPPQRLLVAALGGLGGAIQRLCPPTPDRPAPVRY